MLPENIYWGRKKKKSSKVTLFHSEVTIFYFSLSAIHAYLGEGVGLGGGIDNSNNTWVILQH